MISINNQNNIGSIKINNENIREVLRNQMVIWGNITSIQSCFGSGYWVDNYPWTDNIDWKDK